MIVTSPVSDQRPYVYVRDDKDPDGVFLRYHFGVWQGGRAVIFHPVPASTVPGWLRKERAAVRGPYDAASWSRVTLHDKCLYFDAHEVAVFRKGVEDGQFEPSALI